MNSMGMWFGALVAVIFSGQALAGDTVESYLKKLGSSVFAEREAATLALKDRPEASPAIRKMLNSPNPEAARRAALILEHFDRRSLDELAQSVKGGKLDRAIRIIAEFPKGKNDDELLSSVHEMVRTLTDLHHKKNGAKLTLPYLLPTQRPLTIAADYVDEAPDPRVTRFPYFFVRARKVDMKSEDVDSPKRSLFIPGAIIFSSGSARLIADSALRQIVFAGGTVEISGMSHSAIIVSCGDVVVKGGLEKSLVIARGKIKCVNSTLLDSRIISGEKFEDNRKRAHRCLISEHDANPLGYVRFEERPKTK